MCELKITTETSWVIGYGTEPNTPFEAVFESFKAYKRIEPRNWCMGIHNSLMNWGGHKFTSLNNKTSWFYSMQDLTVNNELFVYNESQLVTNYSKTTKPLNIC